MTPFWRGFFYALSGLWVVDWLCFRFIMAWPHPWQNCGKSRVFAEMLARAGRYAHGPAKEE